MSTLSADPQFKLYALCCAVLSMQMIVLGFLTARARARNKKYMNPEDKAVSFKDATLVEGTEPPDVARIQRAHRNLNETLPLFFALGLIYVIAGASPLGAQICFGAYTGARVLHSIVYLKAMQPWRTMLFGVSVLALIGMIVQVVLAVLT
jgi:prostaglandin-E synthase 1